ncbi:MAG: hypothetical protein FWF37_03980 [Chloroflexi bacterium]|nr:hypothetical protein [Chloroflexota bacterium]
MYATGLFSLTQGIILFSISLATLCALLFVFIINIKKGMRKEDILAYAIGLVLIIFIIYVFFLEELLPHLRNRGCFGDANLTLPLVISILVVIAGLYLLIRFAYKNKK